MNHESRSHVVTDEGLDNVKDTPKQRDSGIREVPVCDKSRGHQEEGRVMDPLCPESHPTSNSRLWSVVKRTTTTIYRGLCERNPNSGRENKDRGLRLNDVGECWSGRPVFSYFRMITTGTGSGS